VEAESRRQREGVRERQGERGREGPLMRDRTIKLNLSLNVTPSVLNLCLVKLTPMIVILRVAMSQSALPPAISSMAMPFALATAIESMRSRLNLDAMIFGGCGCSDFVFLKKR
jgi:hypothetical protein